MLCNMPFSKLLDMTTISHTVESCPDKESGKYLSTLCYYHFVNKLITLSMAVPSVISTENSLIIHLQDIAAEML